MKRLLLLPSHCTWQNQNYFKQLADTEKLLAMRHLFSTSLILIGFALLLAGCTKPDLPLNYRDHGKSATYSSNQTAVQLYRYYNNWRHVRYRYGGLSKKGVDCSGLVYQAYHTLFDIELPRTVASQIRSGHRVSRRRLIAGDLVFFKTGFRQWHVGIYIENDQFLHVSEKKGVTISSLNSTYWGRHYWKGIRVQS